MDEGIVTAHTVKWEDALTTQACSAAGPRPKEPTVRLKRKRDVAGKSRGVRCRLSASMGPCQVQMHKAMVLGMQNE